MDADNQLVGRINHRINSARGHRPHGVCLADRRLGRIAAAAWHSPRRRTHRTYARSEVDGQQRRAHAVRADSHDRDLARFARQRVHLRRSQHQHQRTDLADATAPDQRAGQHRQPPALLHDKRHRDRSEQHAALALVDTAAICGRSVTDRDAAQHNRPCTGPGTLRQSVVLRRRNAFVGARGRRRHDHRPGESSAGNVGNITPPQASPCRSYQRHEVEADHRFCSGHGTCRVS